MNKNQWLGRVSGRVLLLAGFSASDAVNALSRRFEPVPVMGRLFGQGAAPRPELGVVPVSGDAVEWVGMDRGGYAGFWLAGELAVLDVRGTLWDRGASYWSDGLDSYETIGSVLAMARADDRVAHIVMRISSPGGLSEGNLALCEQILGGSARSGGKPVTAFVAGYGASAAYAIAASCDRVVSAPEGATGSIGCLIVHAEESKALEEDGVTVTPIRFGAQKAAFNSYERLSEGAAADLQAQVDTIGEAFVDLVARARPALSRERILETEARVFISDHTDPDKSALAWGLIDAVMHEHELFAELLAIDRDTPGDRDQPAAAAASTSDTEEHTLNYAELLAAAKAAAKDGADAQAICALIEGAATASEDAAETPPADDPAGEKDGDAPVEEEAEEPSGEPEPVNQIQVVQSILGHSAATGREKLAKVLAFQEGMTLEQAVAALEASPKAVPGFPGEVPDPAITAEGGEPENELTARAARARQALGV